MSETSSTPAKKPFEQLTITDDYMFKMVMRDSNRMRDLNVDLPFTVNRQFLGRIEDSADSIG